MRDSAFSLAAVNLWNFVNFSGSQLKPPSRDNMYHYLYIILTLRDQCIILICLNCSHLVMTYFEKKITKRFCFYLHIVFPDIFHFPWRYIQTAQLSFSILSPWVFFSPHPAPNCSWTWYWLNRHNYSNQPKWNRSWLWKNILMAPLLW